MTDVPGRQQLTGYRDHARRTVEVRTDGGFDPCIGGGSSRDCERGECNARAVCAAAALGFGGAVR